MKEIDGLKNRTVEWASLSSKNFDQELRPMISTYGV